MTGSIIQLITSFIIGSLLVYYSIPIIVRISIEKKIYDVPNERRVNKTVVPNLGGIALFIGISIGTLLGIYKTPFPDFRYIAVAMLILFFTGIKDDIIELSARKKFIAQLVCAMILIVLGDIRFTHLHGILGMHEINFYFSFGISLLAIVSIINALNLIDGIDGLAASIGILASIIFGTDFFLANHLQYSILCFATTGSLSTFFVYNVFGKKNKIFMGDTGSLMIGLLLSIFAIKYNEFSIVENEQTRNFSPMFSLAILAVPLFDMVRIFSIRIYQGKSPFAPDINHIHHKLLKLEFSHIKSTLIIIAANLVIISMLYTFRTLNNHLLFILLSSLVVLFSILPEFFFWYKNGRKYLSEKRQFSLTSTPNRYNSKNELIKSDTKEKILNPDRSEKETKLIGFRK